MPKFTYLTDHDKSFNAIWAWAKKLVQDLNAAFQGAGSISGVPTGALMGWGSEDAPIGWLICDGRTMNVADYPALAVYLGASASEVSFVLPDYRNRLLMGAGSSVALGATAGSSSRALGVSNMPAHTHAVTDPGHAHAVTDPGHAHAVTDPGHTHSGGAAAPSNTRTAGGVASVTAQAATASANTGVTVNNANTGVTVGNANTGISVGSVGSGQAFSILPPVAGVNLIIKV